jgi:alpha-1,3-rhamnosyl/mannosyltransferase
LFNFCPTVLSVHDVSYLASRDWYPYKLDRFRKWYYLASMKSAARILVPSEFTRQEICRFLPEVGPRLRKVLLGVSSEFRPDPRLADEVSGRRELPDQFLLHVGDIHPRRNVAMIQSVAAELKFPLVLVGKPLRGAEIDPDCCHLLSGVSRKELVGLYNAATLLVYPSVYEGFGLPILEAMACGLPVVAANRASIPEVCGEAAILVEPVRHALLDGVSRTLGSRQEYVNRGLERARRFTWEETAKKTKQVYGELL